MGWFPLQGPDYGPARLLLLFRDRHRHGQDTGGWPLSFARGFPRTSRHVSNSSPLVPRPSSPSSPSAPQHSAHMSQYPTLTHDRVFLFHSIAFHFQRRPFLTHNAFGVQWQTALCTSSFRPSSFRPLRAPHVRKTNRGILRAYAGPPTNDKQPSVLAHVARRFAARCPTPPGSLWPTQACGLSVTRSWGPAHAPCAPCPPPRASEFRSSPDWKIGSRTRQRPRPVTRRSPVTRCTPLSFFGLPFLRHPSSRLTMCAIGPRAAYEGGLGPSHGCYKYNAFLSTTPISRHCSARVN